MGSCHLALQGHNQAAQPYIVHVEQGSGACRPLPHCLAAKGSDMNTIPSS